MSKSLATSPMLENQRFQSKVFNFNHLKESSDLRSKAMSPVDQNQTILNRALPPLSSTPKPDQSTSPAKNIPKVPGKIVLKSNSLEIKNELLVREIKKLKYELAKLKK